jgi:tRNA-specific 2-thiouridylase
MRRNSRLKLFPDRSVSLGCEKVATGHYARVGLIRQRTVTASTGRIIRRINHTFLGTDKDQLSRATFPLGELPPKSRCRTQSWAGCCRKKESQEICFVPDGDYAGFNDRYLESEGARSTSRTGDC